MSNLIHLASCLGIVALMYFLGSFLKASICPVLAADIGDNRVIPIAMATERAIRKRLALCPLWALALRVPDVSSIPFNLARVVLIVTPMLILPVVVQHHFQASLIVEPLIILFL